MSSSYKNHPKSPFIRAIPPCGTEEPIRKLAEPKSRVVVNCSTCSLRDTRSGEKTHGRILDHLLSGHPHLARGHRRRPLSALQDLSLIHI
ncbi:MAG TPA: hypothetical protein DEV96_12950, partial [Rhodospirillum rubrum]|nr:hypothetical protein [Rhodospirillum rubrum]